MASACVNTIGMSPESFLDCPPPKYQSYGWLSPRVSYSREFPAESESTNTAGPNHSSLLPDKCADGKLQDSDPDVSAKDAGDFEFRLDDPVIMLPADELFSDGKLVPLQLSMIRPVATSAAMPTSMEVRSPDTPKLRIRNEICGTDPYLFSPKAPRCSSRWKELLGLKKLYQNSNAKQDTQKTSSLQANNGHKSLKNFLHRSSKSLHTSIDASLSQPLLKDSDNESVSVSSRLSLSSSSSGHEHDDLPRLSLDSEKPNGHTRNASQNINPPRVRVVKPRALSSENPTAAASRVGRSPMRRAAEATTSTTVVRGVSVDSPRMNSSGKIVFHSLERSSSSPSSFNGGPRYKHRGMERSYSANVRVTPVLNVPVCSLRGSSKSGVFGFPLFSSSQPKKESGSSSSGNGGGSKAHQSIAKHRTDRIKE
nr:uncharacterized protein LOC109178225 [Ipomoea trifida]GME07085.1 uncharacterized serine-rich protein C215.13-like [Ipomoea batatas]GME16727.1 uncharacterized serine-rich protein C215.13-like [Ipomoea batatas]